MARRKPVDYHKAVELLRLVGEPTRLQVLLILADGEQHVGALLARIRLRSVGPLSRHLAFLRLSGIIDQRRQGKNRVYSLTDRGRRLVDGVRTLLD